MKKTLLTLSLIATLSTTALCANAFCWSSLNPFTWGSKCCGAASSCETKDKCACPKKEKKCPKAENKCQKPKCNTCQPKTSNPCEKKSCNPCDKLQEETER